MPGDCPASLRLLPVRLWKTFRSKPNAIPVDDKNCSPSHWNRCSPSDRNAVRLHNGMLFGFRPESRSPSTGFPTWRTKYKFSQWYLGTSTLHFLFSTIYVEMRKREFFPPWQMPTWINTAYCLFSRRRGTPLG